MTAKEDYETRKAERNAEREKIAAMGLGRQEEETNMLLDMADRLVTAVERIADAMEVGTRIKIG